MNVKAILAAACAALACLAAAAQEEEKVLNIYNWSDYIAEDTIRNFEKETGIKVRYDNFDNNEILHAKLVAGKTGQREDGRQLHEGTSRKILVGGGSGRESKPASRRSSRRRA